MPQEKTLIEVLSLRQELDDTRKKLEDYDDTIVSLRGELRTLRESICVTCKRKFVPQNSTSKSRPVGPLSHANRRLHTQSLPEVGLSPQRHHAPESTPKIYEPSTSKIPRYSFSNSPRPLRSKLPQSLPISSAPTCIPRPLPKVVASYEKAPSIFNQQISSSEAILSKVEPSLPLWSVERGILDQTLEVSFVRTLINKYCVRTVRFSPDGKYLAAGTDMQGKDGAVVVHNVETGQQTCVLAEHSSQFFSRQRPGILCLSFSPDGRYLAAGDTNGQITVWNIRNKRICSIFRADSWSTKSVTFSPNGRFLISVLSSGEMCLWRLRDGTAWSFSNDEDYWCAGFSPDGKYIAAGNSDGMLMILDVRTGRMVKRWDIDEGPILCVAFMLDGMGLLCGHKDGSVAYWNIGVVQPSRRAFAARTLEYKGLGRRINEIALSPGARWVAAISDSAAVMWDTYNGIQRHRLFEYSAEVVSVDFSPSGKYLALGNTNGRVNVWKYVSS